MNIGTSKNGLTLRGITTTHALLVLTYLLILAVNMYLVKHYFEANFPMGLLETSSICNLNKFWNCDKATFSVFSNIAHVPISFISLLGTVLLLIGSIFPSENLEKTNKFLSLVNIIGCTFLFLVSIFFLGGLCPLCTAYYILSAFVFFLFYKHGLPGFQPSAKILSLYAVVIIAGSVIIHFYYKSLQKEQLQIGKALIEQFQSLPAVGNPANVTKRFWLSKSDENFDNAKIQISVFSDLQCPACQRFAEQVPMLKKRYGNKINIQYFFYPLDQACNPNMKSAMHMYACQAAYLASCVPDDKFEDLHDYIFANQGKIDIEWLNDLAKKHNVFECMNSQAAKDTVTATIKAGDFYNLQSTPTIIVNGKKLEGAMPLNQWYALFDEMVK